MSFSLTSASEAETAAIAERLAPALEAGDVLLLDGALAAGKTFFVSALARALGADDAVTSPTFAIAQFYSATKAQLLHMDAYRLESLAEFRNLALDDYFPDAITFIEWGERVAAAFPEHLSIRFESEGAGRTLSFSAHGSRWRAALPALAGRLGTSC
jgi:tRNA threonylcarbamoyladenosine biosynthesis protein TsaE